MTAKTKTSSAPPPATKNGASAGGAVAPRAASDAASTGEKETTPLMFLNNATKNFASWEVSVAWARIEDYEYKWEGQDRKGKVFMCTLVSVHDNQQYCVAEIRKTKGSPGDIFEKAVKTYQDGFHFKMSKLPVSIIIVGLGGEDFTKLQVFLK